MAIVDVTFKKKGGPITAEIRCGFAQTGAYILTLWDNNDVEERWEGNFLHPHDDSYELPKPVSSNDGRLLQCRAELGILGDVTQWALIMTLWQDGMKLDDVSDSGDAGDDLLVTVNLWAWLTGQ